MYYFSAESEPALITKKGTSSYTFPYNLKSLDCYTFPRMCLFNFQNLRFLIYDSDFIFHHFYNNIVALFQKLRYSFHLFIGKHCSSPFHNNVHIQTAFFHEEALCKSPDFPYTFLFRNKTDNLFLSVLSGRYSPHRICHYPQNSPCSYCSYHFHHLPMLP